jgi:hypothetical protein
VRGVADVEWRWFAGGVVRFGVYVVSVSRIISLGLAQRCVRGWLGPFVECIAVVFAFAERIGSRWLRAQRDCHRAAAHRERCGPICLAFELFPGSFTLAATAVLLHDVRNLVRDEPITVRRVRLVRACAKMHLAVFGERLRRARGRGTLGNHHDVSQIHAEQLAHPVADERIQRGDLAGLRRSSGRWVEQPIAARCLTRPYTDRQLAMRQAPWRAGQQADRPLIRGMHTFLHRGPRRITRMREGRI